jgi:dethiobiotin synthetase
MNLSKIFKRHKGLFVTGTDTDVGKTYVACLLARQWVKEGLRVGVMKPAESGGNQDAALLKRAAGSQAALEQIRPYYFKAALAPGVAAAKEGRRVSLARIVKGLKALQQGQDGVLLEGAGGLLVPLSGELLVADLARECRLPLLIVARAGLGTINHTLLTLAEARRRGLAVAAVVLNGRAKAGDASPRHNADSIKKLGKVPVFGPLSWGAKSLSR